MKKPDAPRWAAIHLVLVVVLLAAQAGEATTLRRASLENLVESHSTILVAEVTSAVSYWNPEHTFIFTDLTLRPEKILKGAEKGEDTELTITLLGGTVGDLSTLIVGGAQLLPGHSYLLFLNEESMLSGIRRLTVREHSQGVFEFSLSEEGELRALSQAAGAPLVPDSKGLTEPPGGEEGLAPQDVLEKIATLVSGGRS